jgi:hypothetical protein
MPNNIVTLQNQEPALRLLAFQRRLYAHAKQVLTVQLFLVVLVPGALLIAEALKPNLKGWAAFLGLTISVLDTALLDRLKSALRRRGAAVQELFDCQVLGLEWPSLKETKPDHEDIVAGSSDYQSAELKNWYPAELQPLPALVARIICQRSNCWWDSKLRRYYRFGLLGLLALITFGAATIALYKQATLEGFILSVMAPVLPFVLWGIREAQQHHEAAERADHLKCFGDSLWQDAMQRNLADDVALARSRTFQDQIFEHRQSSPLVFNWFYYLLRNKFEIQMQYGATEMVNEAHQRGF